MGGSNLLKEDKVPLRCGRCRSRFENRKELISHAQIVHKVGQMPFRCPDCGIAWYCSLKRLKTHMRLNCQGRGLGTRLEADGGVSTKSEARLPQANCSRRTSTQSEKPVLNTALHFDPLPSAKVRRRTFKSAPALKDRLEASEGSSSLPFSREEPSVNPPSEVSSSYDSFSVSVRMSTRMRTISSSKQKGTKEEQKPSAAADKLGNKIPKGGTKHSSSKLGRKNSPSNFAISSINKSSTPMESKRRLSHANSKVDFSRDLRKRRLITIKPVKSAVCASGTSGASARLATDSSSFNSTNPPKPSELHVDSIKSRKSAADPSKQLHRSQGSSFNHKFLNLTPESKELRVSADAGNEYAGRKKGHTRLKSCSSFVHRRVNQKRACKKVFSKDLPMVENISFQNAGHHVNYAGSVPREPAENQSSTDRSGTYQGIEKETSNAKASSLNSSSSLGLQISPVKKKSRKLIGELNIAKCKEGVEATNFKDTSMTSKDQPSSSKGSACDDGRDEFGVSLSQTTVMLTDVMQSDRLEPSVDVSTPLFSTLRNASVKLELITDMSAVNVNSPKGCPEDGVKSINSNDFIKNCDITTQIKGLTTERASNDDAQMTIAVEDRCDVTHTNNPEASTANGGPEVKPLRQDLGGYELPKLLKSQPSVTSTESTTGDLRFNNTHWMVVPPAGKPNIGSLASTGSSSKSSIASSKEYSCKSKNLVSTEMNTAIGAATMSSTSAVSIAPMAPLLTGKVALVDWDCFIAKDQRRARCNNAAVATAPTTPTHNLSKSPLKSQPLPSANVKVSSYRSSDALTSQLFERCSPRRPKKRFADEVETLSPGKKQDTGDISSGNCSSSQTCFRNSSSSGSLQLFAEGSVVERTSVAMPSKSNEEISPKHVSTSSLDSSLPMNDDEKAVESKASARDENATHTVNPPLSPHDNSDSNSEATAPAVNNSQELAISPTKNRQFERKRLRPRKSIDYFGFAKRTKKRVRMEEVVNEVFSNNGDTRQTDAWKDEDCEKVASNETNECKTKHMTTHCCPVCRLTGFTTLAELKVHRTISCRRKLKKSKRLKERNIEWYCPGCPSTQGPFESAAALLTHLLTCRTKKSVGGRVRVNHPALSAGPLCPSTLLGPSTTFGCSICGVIVASESRLDKHRRDEHNS